MEFVFPSSFWCSTKSTNGFSSFQHFIFFPFGITVTILQEPFAKIGIFQLQTLCNFFIQKQAMKRKFTIIIKTCHFCLPRDHSVSISKTILSYDKVVN